MLKCIYVVFWAILDLQALFPQDDDGVGYDTSDEEFERQLEEASILEEEEKAAAEAAPKKKSKTKKGRGRGGKKKTKLTNKYPTDPDADGYEVEVRSLTL